VLLRLFFVLLLSVPLTAKGLRIVSLAPSITEIIFAIHPTANVVGVTSQCNFPTQTTSIQKLSALPPNAEAIASLHPNLVFSLTPCPPTFQALFKKLKIQWVALPEAKKIDNLKIHYQKIGLSLNKQTQANLAYQSLENQLIKSRSKSPQKTALMILWVTPLMVIGPQSFVSDLMTYAGLKNAIKSPLSYPKINMETVLSLNPDVLVFAEAKLVEPFLKLPGASALGAVKNHRMVIVKNTDTVLRPGPRIWLGVQELQKHL